MRGAQGAGRESYLLYDERPTPQGNKADDGLVGKLLTVQQTALYSAGHKSHTKSAVCAHWFSRTRVYPALSANVGL